MTIKQTMSTAIANDPNTIRAVVNEAKDGIKAVPTELVLKAADDSTFTQVSESNPVPTKLMGSYVGYSTDNKSAIAPNPKRGDDFLELNTGNVYIYDGSGWVLFA